jgi:hypothetical protein
MPPCKAPAIFPSAQTLMVQWRSRKPRSTRSPKRFPLGDVGYENATNEKVERLIWLPQNVLDKLNHCARLASWRGGV